MVTGGASGLGAATARALTSGGASVTILDLQEEKGEALAAELGGGTKFVMTDITDPDQVATAVELAGADGPLRVAINCAGIGWAERTVARDGTPADFDRFKKVVQVNLFGTFNILSQVAGAMSKLDPLEFGERGVIVNTASVAAFDGQIGQAAYSASKGGVVGMTLPIARDLAAVGVRVCTICPGIFDTPLLALLPEPAREALAAGVPFPKRLGVPDDFAKMALAIIDNGYMNGETVRLDGSLRMAPK